ncbi:MAG TPA: (Fe-S)-binding protein [Candidatus Deferrimicrobium sp.]|nr:(Fe-S)-binding protein [Candidatus Deferrimicrobium sp.]
MNENEKENKSETTESANPFEEKIDRLSAADREKVLKAFGEKINHEQAVYANSCVHCGLCADSCHYYLTHHDIHSLPAYKLGLVIGIFKKYFSFTGKNMSRWVGARTFDNAMIKEWVDSLYGRCSMCGRCSLNCSIGINIASLIRAARGALSTIDLIPPGLQSTIETAVKKGNNMGIKKDDWLDTASWLEEELQAEIADPAARIPMDQKDARYFYTINPREAMFFPLSITAVAKLFHAAGESWTLAGDGYDITNYGLYSGDDKTAGMLSDRLVQAMTKLGCKTLVLGECGHGFKSNRWEAPEWLSKKYGFEVKSILEVVAGFIQEGRIKLDPAKNQEWVTLHDPCNLVRMGGIVEEQRFILKHAVTHFIEMIPNRQKNFCCGGGGGQLAMTQFSSRRLAAGKVKADQIRKTGAKIVAAPCHNCIDQLMELNKHYQLDIKIKTVCEIAADALIL